MGKCPVCQAWNTLVEEVEKVDSSNQSTIGFDPNKTSVRAKTEKITIIATDKEPHVTTSMKEFKRVLGGGIVPGSLVLIGGDPGIGKSTLLLQTSSQIAEKKLRTLYVSGEESMQQTKLRAERLDIMSEELFVLAETNLYHI